MTKETKSSPEQPTPQEIPLNQLTVWTGNIRKTKRFDNLAEMQASILAHGLINPLLVMKSENSFTTICGNRRLMALRVLCGEGKLPEDYPVSCMVLLETTKAKELSLAENVVRQAMNPLDEAEAYHFLAEKGDTIEQIGQHFGVTPAVVKKRLALSTVSDAVKEALTAGTLNLAQAQAFTVTDDHKRQEKLLQETEFGDLEEDGTYDLDTDDIRDFLTENKIPATDRRVRFVTVEAYKAAGGAVTTDLFIDDEDGIYIENASLLKNLVNNKLEALKKEIKAEGWKFVIAKSEGLDYRDTSKYDKGSYKIKTLSDADEIDRKAYTKELDALPQCWQRNAAQEKRGDELDFLLDELKEKTIEWPSQTKAKAGVLIGLSDNGNPSIERGLINKKTAEKNKNKKTTGKKSTAKKKKDEESFPDKTLHQLAIHRSSALSAALIEENTDVALSALLHRMALCLCYYAEDYQLSCINVTISTSLGTVVTKKGSVKGITALNKADEAWRKMLPEKAEDLWIWIRKLDTHQITSLLAHLTALSIDDTALKQHPCAAQIAAALNLDMTQWYKPTADNLFKHMGKPQLLKTVKEIRGKPLSSTEKKMGKEQLAKLAEKETAEKNWLPAPLCFPHTEKKP